MAIKKTSTITRYLYCIQDVDRKIMKVGISQRPRSRVLALSHDCPSAFRPVRFTDRGFLWICQATQADETRIHKQLKAYRLSQESGIGRVTEWYRHDEAIVEAVKAVGPRIRLKDTPPRLKWTGNQYVSGQFRRKDWNRIRAAVKAFEFPEKYTSWIVTRINDALTSRKPTVR